MIVRAKVVRLYNYLRNRLMALPQKKIHEHAHDKCIYYLFFSRLKNSNKTTMRDIRKRRVSANLNPSSDYSNKYV